ncbi:MULTISPECIES: DUF6660 family protein [Olivibacter]|uniref:DUF6660 family protein n=1 Tax=Olivibacter oleidegradans TaxID=760123 RepID=A0ABV6HQE5_9SPHI|nr:MULTISPECIES: DUF6660 family protein [Olivibacter]QEL03884.1 hypothetical protein FKG96_24650 [Olivibacter sp. LS-1]
MKWLVYLFSIYVLVLSAVPCGAEDNCCIDETYSLAEREKPAEERDHRSICPCSPFFACGVCSGAVLPNAIMAVIKELSPILQQPFSYQEYPLLELPRTIWQPPKAA